MRRRIVLLVAALMLMAALALAGVNAQQVSGGCRANVRRTIATETTIEIQYWEKIREFVNKNGVLVCRYQLVRVAQS